MKAHCKNTHPERHSFPHIFCSQIIIFFVTVCQHNTTFALVGFVVLLVLLGQSYTGPHFVIGNAVALKLYKKKPKICHTLSGIEGRFACFIHVIYYCCCFTTTDTAQEKCVYFSFKYDLAENTVFSSEAS